jgi:hypothetical protein
VPIVYSRGPSDAELHSRQARDLQAQLEKLDKEIAVKKAAADADPEYTWLRLQYQPLVRLRNEIASKLHVARANAGMDHNDVPRALSSGSYWHGSDS